MTASSAIETSDDRDAVLREAVAALRMTVQQLREELRAERECNQQLHEKAARDLHELCAYGMRCMTST
jgi:predicted nuclease of restriction endonuclease-like RecB superfamily